MSKPPASTPEPLVSFVIPVWNRANVLETALQGVFAERASHYPNSEVIVIDGGSTDGTVDVIRKHADQFQYWISERDSGVADAWNKGVKAARGEIIRLVASDDVFELGHTRQMVEYLREHPEIDVLGARARYFHVLADGTRRPQEVYNRLLGGWVTREELATWCNRGVFGPIETWHFRRRAFDRVGGFDNRYRISSDLDWAYRLVHGGGLMFILDDRIVEKCFFADGSNAVADVARAMRECRELMQRHAGFVDESLLVPEGMPHPLNPPRGFWSLWLRAIKGWQRASPGSYAAARRCLGRK